MNKLEEIIEDNCMSKSRLAREIVVSTSTVTRICNGQVTATYETAKLLSDFFENKITIGEIMSITPIDLKE